MWRFMSRIRGVTLKWPRKVVEPDSWARCDPGNVPSDDRVWVKGGGAGGKATLTVCVEGNIGSGKSTLLRYLEKFGDVEVVSESVDKWRGVRGNNLLDLMYRDPARWSFLFQSYVQLTMAESHARLSQLPVKFMERSIHSARFCFVENMYLSGKMSEVEYYVYCEWYKKMTEYFDCGVDLAIYLRTDPRLVYDRARRRSRTEEQQIPLQYFEELHTRYEEWFCDEKFPLPCPVLIINANDDLPAMYRKYSIFAKQIMSRKSLISSLV